MSFLHRLDIIAPDEDYPLAQALVARHISFGWEEESLPTGYKTPSITDNGKGTVAAGTAQEVTVTNTYEPEGITVDPNNDDTNYPFKAVKILQGRNWNGEEKFGFKLEAVTDGA